MKYDGPKWDKEQLVTFAEINIEAVVDCVLTYWDGRWMDGSKDEEWRKRQPPDHSRLAYQFALEQMERNLSFLYATLTSDSMALDEASAHANIGNALERWAEDWWEGNRGIMPDGNEDIPAVKLMAERWVNEVFGSYLLPS